MEHFHLSGGARETLGTYLTVQEGVWLDSVNPLLVVSFSENNIWGILVTVLSKVKSKGFGKLGGWAHSSLLNGESTGGSQEREQYNKTRHGGAIRLFLRRKKERLRSKVQQRRVRADVRVGF